MKPKVLIVDDDLMLADNLEDVLIAGGYDVCGIASNVTDAIRIGRATHPNLGVIDLRLGDGGFGTEVATALRCYGEFGVLYSTGNPEHTLLAHAEGEGCITKPFMPASLLTALRIVRDRMADIPASAAFPKGFRLLTPASHS
jgi:two-component system, response regulator PdtaR